MSSVDNAVRSVGKNEGGHFNVIGWFQNMKAPLLCISKLQETNGTIPNGPPQDILGNDPSATFICQGHNKTGHLAGAEFRLCLQPIILIRCMLPSRFLMWEL